MTWDNGDRWGSGDRVLTERAPRRLALPVAAGLLGGLVVHLVLYTVILAAAVTVTGSGDFTSGDAVVWGIVGAVGLAAATAACAWIIRRTATARDVTAETVRRTSLVTAVVFAATMIVLALAPGLRPVTLPVYVVLTLAAAFWPNRRR